METADIIISSLILGCIIVFGGFAIRESWRELMYLRRNRKRREKYWSKRD